MRTSLWGKVLLPPLESEAATAERKRQTSLAHGGVALFTVAIDVVLYLMLRHAELLRPEMVRLFAELNIPLLTASALLCFFARRRPHRLYGAVQVLGLLFEATSMLVWIQMTGIVSSYFLIMAILLICSYRIAYDYWLGLVCVIIVVALHTGAYVLEEVHVIQPASLFVAGAGATYASATFRIGALSSILWCDILAFFTANYLVDALKQKDRELRLARRDLDRAVKKAEVGRLSGQVLGRAYELGELLGRGGMGEVYQARRISDGREVAVKVLLSDMVQEPTVRERFQREAQVIAKLPPQYVAGFIELATSEDGHDFLVMELLRGEDLGAVLRRRGHLDTNELLPIVNGIAEALAAAHAAGVVHRDLKPPNVFVDTAGAVRLLDFGIARLLEGESSRTLTMTSVVLGTPGYLAPEQARGQHTLVGPRADIFAFGAIIYRAVTGKNAFPSRNAVAAAYEALCYHPPPPSSLVPGLPSDVDAVLALAMAKNVTDRYVDPRHLAHDLEQALRGVLPETVRVRARSLEESAPTAEATLATMAGSRSAH
jgi:serine/threonine-protein kinase